MTDKTAGSASVFKTKNNEIVDTNEYDDCLHILY